MLLECAKKAQAVLSVSDHRSHAPLVPHLRGPEELF